MEIRKLEICLRREIGLEALRRVADTDEQVFVQLLNLANGDEEALFMLSLTLFHSEREKGIFQQICRFKPHVVNPKFIQGKLVRVLFPVAVVVTSESVEKQMQTWKGRIPEIQMTIRRIIDYFRPAVVPKKVVIVPSDTIVTETSGRSFVVGEEFLISSHTTNRHNLIHEFLHSLINPIIYDELLLSDAQKKQIIVMAGGYLQDYREYPLSLLAEALIRVYNDAIRHGKELQYPDSLRNSVVQLYYKYACVCKKGPVSFQTFLLAHISNLIPTP